MTDIQLDDKTLCKSKCTTYDAGSETSHKSELKHVSL